MKKILLLIFLFFAIQLNCFANNEISFIYINGSNNNDTKMKNWYENGVKKLHPYMKNAFEDNDLTYKYFLNDGEYSINPNPIIFFWGDKSYKDLAFVESDLAISKGFSPWAAYTVRAMITHFLHDAIWVQKYHNMLPILDDLHKQVQAEAKKGNKVVLYGYSAGSFVTYEYLLTRLPFINIAEFFNKVGATKEQKEFIKQHPVNDSCMKALGNDLAVFSAAGNIIPNDTDIETFKKDYLRLNDLTKEVCVPDNSIKGIINFASPLVLFYSDLSDPNFELTYFNRLLVKYLIENDMFWITVNYREDPLGFPCGRNLTIAEMEKYANIDIEPHAGFIHDQSNTKGRRMVFVAHTSYWGTRKNFSKAVAKAYLNGYFHKNGDTCPIAKKKRTFKKPKL